MKFYLFHDVTLKLILHQVEKDVLFDDFMIKTK